MFKRKLESWIECQSSMSRQFNGQFREFGGGKKYKINIDEKKR